MQSCPRPMHAFYTGEHTANGGQQMIFKDRFTTEIEYITRKGKKVNLIDFVEVPCGKCMICKANQARQKSERAIAEVATWENNEVINLTYNDENLPYNTFENKKVPTLRYKDVQDFKKRLLKYWKEHYNADGIKFLCACEYGEQYHRPHYHMIMFNFKCEDKYDWGTTKKGSKAFRSPIIEKLWGKGNVTLGEVTPETVYYVSNYCLKKFKGKQAKGIYRELGIEPESVKSSNRRGLGAIFYDKHKELYKNTGKCFVGTFNGLKTISTNRYFDKLLAEDYGEDTLKQIKKERQNLQEAREKTRAQVTGVDIEILRENDERQFLEKIKSAKQRNFKEEDA